MTKTTNYNLNQWEATDVVKREDFNADNAAIDAALKAVANVAAAAQSSAATAAANAATAAATRGNCQIYYTTRVGTDSTSRITITVPKGKPHLLFLYNNTGQDYMLTARGNVFPGIISHDKYMSVSWSDTTVSWKCNDGNYIYNFDNSAVTYYLLILSEIV